MNRRHSICKYETGWSMRAEIYYNTILNTPEVIPFIRGTYESFSYNLLKVLETNEIKGNTFFNNGKTYLFFLLSAMLFSRFLIYKTFTAENKMDIIFSSKEDKDIVKMFYSKLESSMINMQQIKIVQNLLDTIKDPEVHIEISNNDLSDVLLEILAERVNTLEFNT